MPVCDQHRLLAAVASHLGWDFLHLDAEQAFVQSELKEDVHIRLPKGCVPLSGKVVKLARTLVWFEASVPHVALPFGQGDGALRFEQGGCVQDASD